MGQVASACAGLPEREPRIRTHEQCVIVRQGGVVLTAVLINLSERGFCVEATSPLEKNEQVEMRVLGTLVGGAVKWTRGCRAGCALAKDLP
jgi:hypothetical protein